MTKTVKDCIKNVAVLVLIALCSGLLLGAFNKLTYVDPKAEAMRKFSELYPKESAYELLTENPEEGVIYVAESGGTVAILSVGTGGYKGKVQTYVFFENGKIAYVEEGEHGETYVGKLHDGGFFDKFRGANADGFNPEDYDGVTGASRSSAAVRRGVEIAANYYSAHFAGGEFRG